MIFFFIIKNLLSSPMEPYRKPGRLLYSGLPLSSEGGICLHDGQRCSATDVSTNLNIVLIYSKYLMYWYYYIGERGNKIG